MKTEKSKKQQKKLEEEIKILQNQLTAFEKAYLRQRATLKLIEIFFIYELGEEKWNRVINSKEIDCELKRLQEEPVLVANI